MTPSGPRVDSDLRWRAFASVKGVDRHAHLIDEPLPFALADRSLCGLRGRALSLLGTKPSACPKCVALRSTEEENPHAS